MVNRVDTVLYPRKVSSFSRIIQANKQQADRQPAGKQIGPQIGRQTERRQVDMKVANRQSDM
jgi:hypothetical protein